MSCKNCTCYVDGHSKNGTKLPAGQGLCTMHNQDVSADGNCDSCMSVNGDQSNPKQSYPFNGSSTNNVTKKPRRAMKVWAIICFVFAGIYALMSFAISAMFGMTIFLGILGIMFVVLHKSPKENPYILGKQSGLTKTIFVIICVALAFCSFTMFAMNSEDMEGMDDANGTSSSVSTNDNDSVSNEHKVTSIGNFKETEYELLVGETLDFTLELKPKDLTAEDVVIEIANSSIVKVSDMQLKTESRKTILSFKCEATAEGETTLVVKSACGEKSSNTITFKTQIPPIVTAIGRFSPSYAVQEVGDTRHMTVYMKPTDLSKDDVKIVNSDTGILKISNVAFKTEGEQTVLTFDVIGIAAGSASIKIQGADGKTESNELSFTINEKDTSPRVYVTPYGDRYHYSAACAGKNASATTRNKAIRSGKTGCGKCT